jgi:putative transposase
MNKIEMKKGKISNEVLDSLIGEAKTAADVFGREGLLKRLSAQLLERMLGAELDHHLSQDDDVASPDSSSETQSRNRRNGSSKKTVALDQSQVTLAVPRDRDSSFQPIIVPKHLRRLPGFDQKVLTLYSRGVSTRDISEMMSDFYGVEISATLVSEVTEAVRDEIKTWQGRPLQACYALVWIDAICIKVRDEGVVANKSLYVAVGVTLEGKKEVLGMWLEATEGAKFWQRVLSEIGARGTQDILIVCCDGLKGLPQAIGSVFPKTTVQSCIVHQIRYSVSFASWKDRRPLVAALKSVYAAPTEEIALQKLQQFEDVWGKRFPMIVKSWRSNWEVLRPYFELPIVLRKMMYTTNQIESLNSCIRRTVRAKGHFSSEDAALKSVYLTFKNLQTKWDNSVPQNWKEIYRALHIHFGERATAKN